jgi:hypothetical protein
MYALAASAAGVSVLALAQPSEAKIVYTTVHVIIGHGGVSDYKLDLNHDGVTDISFSTARNACTSGCFVYLFADLPTGNEVRAEKFESGGYSVSALRRGARIGNAGLVACAGACLMAFDGSGIYHPRGEWLNVKNRYVGLKLEIRGKAHFGWARLSVAIQPSQVTATLTGYAYETIPNKPIIAGKTKGPDVTTVSPASLGHLAAGASAIPSWRVKRTVATTH